MLRSGCWASFLVGEVLLQLGELEQVEQVLTHRDLVLLGDADLGHQGLGVTVGAADQKGVAPIRLHRRVVVAGVTAPALGALQRGLGDALTDQHHVAQVDRQVPARVERPASVDADTLVPLTQLGQLVQRLGDFFFLADDADQAVHRVLQVELQRVRILR